LKTIRKARTRMPHRTCGEVDWCSLSKTNHDGGEIKRDDYRERLAGGLGREREEGARGRKKVELKGFVNWQFS
jgi:hypothetical protein